MHGIQELQHAGSVLVTHRLQSVGSGDVARGLSWSVASGIFLDQGLNLCPLHLQVDSYPLYDQGSPCGLSHGNIHDENNLSQRVLQE